eukprot:CAMPEP_0197006170 /NCGR_PEP_ID=MMETSP1380-20130617/33175_1 /TAXON_ID=5936 /ORGANISM="Euplotes crassus, Strain CT5" /LENGTH=217 /DNA_ID=CAMNT_0042425615 /DNA_START=26 /DNA_END=679 /DNA_ORIENTATION=+
MKLVLLLVAILAFSFALDVPNRPDGYSYGTPEDPTATLDVFVDILCSACKAFEPQFIDFLSNYTIHDRPVTDFLDIKFHIFPLPYHHNAFFISRLAPFIQDTKPDQLSVVEFIHWGLSVQDRYLSSGSLDKAEPEVLKNMCTDFTEEIAKGIHSFEDCMAAMHNRNYELDARASWKYAAYMGVNGTPTLLLNGVPVDPPFDAEEWPKFLEKYLPSES